jgi:hypothetical protein
MCIFVQFALTLCSDALYNLDKNLKIQKKFKKLKGHNVGLSHI